MFDLKAYITMYVVRKTRSVLDQNLIRFKITPLQQLNSPPSSWPPIFTQLIVVSLMSATGRCSLICPPDPKKGPLSYFLPRQKIQPKSPRKNNAVTPSPGRSSPRSQGSLVDCCIIEVGDRAVRSNSPTRLQIATSFLPPPAKKSTKIPL